jgi:hypothetical protein
MVAFTLVPLVGKGAITYWNPTRLQHLRQAFRVVGEDATDKLFTVARDRQVEKLNGDL